MCAVSDFSCEFFSLLLSLSLSIALSLARSLSLCLSILCVQVGLRDRMQHLPSELSGVCVCVCVCVCVYVADLSQLIEIFSIENIYFVHNIWQKMSSRVRVKG